MNLHESYLKFCEEYAKFIAGQENSLADTLHTQNAAFSLESFTLEFYDSKEAFEAQSLENPAEDQQTWKVHGEPIFYEENKEDTFLSWLAFHAILSGNLNALNKFDFQGFWSKEEGSLIY